MWHSERGGGPATAVFVDIGISVRRGASNGIEGLAGDLDKVVLVGTMEWRKNLTLSIST